MGDNDTNTGTKGTRHVGGSSDYERKLDFLLVSVKGDNSQP